MGGSDGESLTGVVLDSGQGAWGPRALGVRPSVAASTTLFPGTARGLFGGLGPVTASPSLQFFVCKAG